MQLTGQTVSHKTFGNGVVTGQEDHSITVSFPQGEKRFIYPDAFKSFLTMRDDTAEEKVQDLLVARKEARTEKLQALLEEQERQQRIHNFKISVNSQVAFALEMEEEDSLEDWTVSTGTYLSGAAKGLPRVPDKMKPNSCCLLTRKPEGGVEEDREILGICMVPEDFFGDECSDGSVTAHPQYRILLPEDKTMLFWDYFASLKRKPRWGSTVFKYFSNKIMQRILDQLRTLLADTEQAELSEDFYNYYCRLNQLPAVHF